MSLTCVMVARIPAAGIDAFQRYESEVLPILADHGAVLERRLRSVDGGTEVHVIRFPSAAAFSAYHDDPRRQEHRHLLRASAADVALHELRDV